MSKSDFKHEERSDEKSDNVHYFSFGRRNNSACPSGYTASNPGTEPGLIPAQASRVTGNVFINAEFGDNVVNGLIYNRTNLDANEQLNNVVLIVSTINSNGSFLGKVQSQPVDGTAPVAIGDYGGTFGGLNASGVAGGVHLENYLDNVENEQEYGIFVLTQCGLAGDGGAICDDVQPDF